MAYNPQMTPADNRIIKRQMTDAERRLVVKSFQGNQKALRILAPVPILLFAVIVFISNAGDNTVLNVVYYLFIVVTIILCALIIAMSGWMFQLRKKTAEVLAEGTAIEVRGIATKNQESKNAQTSSYVVGPITVSVKKEDSHLIHEGAQTIILCVPILSAALSANGAELHGAWAKCPPDLEATAEPMGQQ
jgi:hypothetical protein